ncbi:MAG: prepilin-type N-terminal cleavage/methylation domain-containing protein [Pseudomonadota bacterium]|nr:prepilin-type N-terminal cleavage/methylation domain-containing protein [Pseudomonadota bacterium]
MTAKQRNKARVTNVDTGFTLVEMVVFIVVLAVGLSGVVLVINRTLLDAPEALVNTRAMEISQLYLDEILAKKYDNNTPQGGTPPCNTAGNPCIPDDTCNHADPNTFGSDSESRDQFDDVDDYCTTDFQTVADANDNDLPNYDGYDIKVDVVYAGTDLGLNLDQAKRITVTVRTPRNQQIPVTVYRTNF